MEGLTRAVWEFMEGAHSKGLLDELLGLAGALSDPEVDLGEQLGNFEDRLADADFTGFEEMSTEVLTPLLRALAEEKVMESLHVLVITLRPLVNGALERVGSEPRVIKEVLGLVKKNLVCLKTVSVALAPVMAKVYGPAVEAFVKERGGGLAGEIINRACTAINRNPDMATQMISDLFATVDGGAVGTAADTVVGAVLDQKPHVIGWTAGTLVRRTKKRLLGS